MVGFWDFLVGGGGVVEMVVLMVVMWLFWVGVV